MLAYASHFQRESTAILRKYQKILRKIPRICFVKTKINSFLERQKLIKYEKDYIISKTDISLPDYISHPSSSSSHNISVYDFIFTI